MQCLHLRLQVGLPQCDINALELDEIALHCAALPLLDPRLDEEILGYDEYGLPS